MKILVTGVLGFIGSAFTRFVLQEYDDVNIIGVNRYSNQKNKERLEDVWRDKRFSMYYADFARDSLSDAFQDVDYVAHFGAKTFVDYSIRDPAPFIESNIVGTYRLLEEARKSRSLKKFLQFSTDEVYGSIMKGSYTEDSRLRPSNPYAATKAAGDMLALSYHNTYSLPIVVSRTENVYGPYQGREKVFPTFVRKAMADEPLPVYGDGSHVRQWCHVEDAITGALLLLDKGTPGEVYHIAGHQELKNLDLATMILYVLGKPSDRITFIPDSEIRPGHDKRYSLSSEKIGELGWNPKWNLAEGIKSVAEWYRDNMEWHE